MRAGYGMLLVLGVAALVAGCGGATQSPASLGTQTEPRISGQTFSQELAAAPEAEAAEVDYHGWQALQLSNGLVTVIAVPAAGGRILSYKLGEAECLRAEATLYGKTDDGKGEALDFGGDRPQLSSGDREATALVLNGKWTGSVTTARGILAEVKMVSPEDQAAGVQLTRTLRLYAGTTHLQVAESLRNTGDKPAKWSLGSASAVQSVTGSKPPSGEVQAYIPAATGLSAHPEGFWSLSGDKDLAQVLPGGERQVQVAYQGKAGAVAVRNTAGWLAVTDTVNQRTYVRRFQVNELHDYPGGAMVEVVAGEYAGGRGGLKLLSRGPLQEVAPGRQVTFVQDWFATMAPGPIRGVTDLAALTQPLELKPESDKLRLQGKLGVFAAGNLLITLLDASGQSVGTPISLAVTPSKVLEVNQELRASGASTVRLAMESERGTPLGQVVELPAQ